MQISIDELKAHLFDVISRSLLGKTTDSYDVVSIAHLQAAWESATYFNEHMGNAKNFPDDISLLSHAMGLRPQGGQVLEFGVASGRTINHISSLTEDPVYGFDVFSGLPESWRLGYDKGMFGRDRLPDVNSNVKLIVGLFEDTLKEFSRTHVEPISFLHIDCDLYDGTKSIFSYLGSRIVPGTGIVFDEYFNYPGWSKHEFRAFREFVSCKGLNYRYDSLVSKHQQVCVVIE
jgi:hypothetical protein